MQSLGRGRRSRRIAVSLWLAIAVVAWAVGVRGSWRTLRWAASTSAVCVDRPPYGEILEAFPEMQSPILLTGTEGMEAAQRIFCAQYALAPLPVRRIAAPQAASSAILPGAVFLVEVDDSEALAQLQAELGAAAAARGLQLEVEALPSGITAIHLIAP